MNEYILFYSPIFINNFELRNYPPCHSRPPVGIDSSGNPDSFLGNKEGLRFPLEPIPGGDENDKKRSFVIQNK